MAIFWLFFYLVLKVDCSWFLWYYGAIGLCIQITGVVHNHNRSYLYMYKQWTSTSTFIIQKIGCCIDGDNLVDCFLFGPQRMIVSLYDIHFWNVLSPLTISADLNDFRPYTIQCYILSGFNMSPFCWNMDSVDKTNQYYIMNRYHCTTPCVVRIHHI